MKKLAAIVLLLSLVAACMFVYVYPKTYHDSPANSGVSAEANDTPGPGASEILGPHSYLKELRSALQSDPMVLAEFLCYMGEMDGLNIAVATNINTTARLPLRNDFYIDVAAGIFLRESKLRAKALAKASDLFLTRCVLSDESERIVANLRSFVPLRSTDLTSYEAYNRYLERQKRLYSYTSVTRAAASPAPVEPELASDPPGKHWDASGI